MSSHSTFLAPSLSKSFVRRGFFPNTSCSPQCKKRLLKAANAVLRRPCHAGAGIKVASANLPLLASTRPRTASSRVDGWMDGWMSWRRKQQQQLQLVRRKVVDGAPWRSPRSGAVPNRDGDPGHRAPNEGPQKHGEPVESKAWCEALDCVVACPVFSWRSGRKPSCVFAIVGTF